MSLARKLQNLRFRDEGLNRFSPLEGLILSNVYRFPGVTPSELGEELGLRSSNTSSALRSLESQGLITRTKSPHDPRSVQIHITPTAEEVLRRVWDEYSRFLASADLSGEDLDAVAENLHEVDEQLRPSPDSDPRR